MRAWGLRLRLWSLAHFRRQRTFKILRLNKEILNFDLHLEYDEPGTSSHMIICVIPLAAAVARFILGVL